MLTCRPWTIACCLALIGCGAVACTDDVSAPSPTTVDPAAAAGSSGVLTVRVGAIINTEAPTAERDERLAGLLDEVAASVGPGAAIDIEVITIDEVSDVDSAVSALVEEGVTVIAALCDDASVPPIVAATVERGLLAITSCVTLPTPPLVEPSELFFDLSGMDDAAAAMVAWGIEQQAASVATIRSNLIPDVEETCTRFEAAAAVGDLSLDASISFTELLDDPDGVIDDAAPLLDDTDLIALCALPPTADDMVSALRAAGHDQPVLLPWFADTQVWSDGIDDVYVIAPASRYGDDPVPSVMELFATIGESAQAADVVTADSIALLAAAAERVGSVGSTRLAAALMDSETEVLSGTLEIGQDGQPVGRTYRVIEVSGGLPSFEDVVVAPSR